MTEDVKQNLRLMLATTLKDAPVHVLEEKYKWIVGKESKIVAVSETGVVKS